MVWYKRNHMVLDPWIWYGSSTDFCVSSLECTLGRTVSEARPFAASFLCR